MKLFLLAVVVLVASQQTQAQWEQHWDKSQDQPLDQPLDQDEPLDQHQPLDQHIDQPRIRHQKKKRKKNNHKHLEKTGIKDLKDADALWRLTNDYLTSRKTDTLYPKNKHFRKCVKKNPLKKCQKRFIRSLAKKEEVSQQIEIANHKKRSDGRKKVHAKKRKDSRKKLRSSTSRRQYQSSGCITSDNGPTFINTTTHICCGGEVLPIAPTTITAGSCQRDPSLTGCRGCCDQAVYNTSTHFCYQGLLQRKEDSPWLLVADITGNLFKLSTNGSVVESVKNLTSSPSSKAVMLDVSYAAGAVYTSEIKLGLNTISKVVLPGQMTPSRRSTLYSNSSTKFNYLAVDWISSNVYLIDIISTSLSVTDTKMKYMKTLFEDETFFEEPKAMELYPSIGHIYISSAGKDPHISRVSMDGKTQQRLVSDVVIPSAIAIHHSSQTLYWADSFTGHICMSDLLGRNKEVILEKRLSFDMAMTLIDNILVWTDEFTIVTLRLELPRSTSLFTLEDFDNLKSIEAVDNHRNHFVRDNPCQPLHCSQLCLLSPAENVASHNDTDKVGAVCACTDDYKLGSDNRTCTQNCTSSQFLCGSPSTKQPRCIPSWWQCDGHRDCEDGSDEPDNCRPYYCREPHMFQCDNATSAQHCISPHKICDGVASCDDSSDEHQWNNCSEHSCMHHQFKCEADGMCMAKTKLCDGIEDCSDGVDEANCSGPASTTDYTIKRVDDLDDKVLDNEDDSSHSSPAKNYTVVILGVLLAGIVCAVIFSVGVILCNRSSLRVRLFKRKNCSGQQGAESSEVGIMNNISSNITLQRSDFHQQSHAPAVNPAISEISTINSRSDAYSMHSKLSLRLDELPTVIDKSRWEKFYTKGSNVPENNTYESLTKTVETQTMCLKETNMRDSLGKPFQGQFTATVTEPVVQLPHSDVTMNLPRTDLQKDNIQCHASSLTNVGLLRKKFRVPDDQSIASPAIEYQLYGMSWLEDYAVIKLPICTSNSYRILRADSDQGASEYFEDVQEVPRVTTKDEGQGLDFFYIPSDSRAFVYIYTKHFSVYICLDCGDELPLQSKVFIFAGVKRCGSSKAIVSMELILTGQLSRFKDYKQQLVDEHKEVGRTLVDFPAMNFKRRLQSVDQIEIKMSIEDTSSWDFVRPPGNPSYEVATKNFSAKEMVQCQCKNGMPFINFNWQIASQTPAVPGYCHCNLDIFHLPRDPDGDSATATQDGHGHREQVCYHAIFQSTEQSRSSSRYSSASNSSSRRSRDSQHYSSGYGIQTGRDLEVVRKEIDTSTPSSYYSRDGQQKRHPAIPVPAPELTKPPECSFDNQGNRPSWR